MDMLRAEVNRLNEENEQMVKSNQYLWAKLRAALRRGERYVAIVSMCDWADKTHASIARRTNH